MSPSLEDPCGCFLYPWCSLNSGAHREEEQESNTPLQEFCLNKLLSICLYVVYKKLNLLMLKCNVLSSGCTFHFRFPMNFRSTSQVLKETKEKKSSLFRSHHLSDQGNWRKKCWIFFLISFSLRIEPLLRKMIFLDQSGLVGKTEATVCLFNRKKMNIKTFRLR